MSFTRYESLKGRAVVITGGASGIGAAFVRAFAENGARVAFLDLQEDAGATLAGSLGAMFVPCDLTDIPALHAALAKIRTALGPAAVLVNNAANDQRYDFAAISPDEFDRTIALNFRHVFFAAQAVVPQMRELGHGSIINMSSVSWMRGIPFLEAYASAKAAVIQFSRVTAVQYAGKGIRVNTVVPGQMHTPMVEARLAKQRAGGDVEALLKSRVARIPLGFMGDGRDTAAAVLFLASDEARFITGTEVVVDGGMTARCD